MDRARARELAARLQAAAAGRARRDALDAVAKAYGAYAREHPGTYAALQQPLTVEADDEASAAAQAAVVDVVLAVLRGYGLEGDEAIHATRTLRAALHGFVSLEAESGFGIPLSPDESFSRLVDVLAGGPPGSATFRRGTA
ncbi:MAG TPA: TetR-like C-terminal domain-containing protein [Solirubrobacteraceae bacterium]|nr:TetR-like C-terminal domain-containing protein [Solirubrobacteraceae bacterium]